MAEVILNNDNFKAEVLDAKGLVLVDFWATWCGPCKMLAPTVSEIADEYEGKVKVCKLDVDQAMDIAMSYGVASIPTLILFKDGEIVKKSIGVVSKAEIEATQEILADMHCCSPFPIWTRSGRTSARQTRTVHSTKAAKKPSALQRSLLFCFSM